jgi:hypothetical protein
VVQGIPQRYLRCVELFAQHQIGIDDAAKNRFELAQDGFSAQTFVSCCGTVLCAAKPANKRLDRSVAPVVIFVRQ